MSLIIKKSDLFKSINYTQGVSYIRQQQAMNTNSQIIIEICCELKMSFNQKLLSVLFCNPLG